MGAFWGPQEPCAQSKTPREDLKFDVGGLEFCDFLMLYF
jgi:hypothetical protein